MADEIVGLCFEPLDPLLFRDGRPFGEAGIARTRDLPMPQTVAGAVRTWLMEALGCDFNRMEDTREFFERVLAETRFHGPWFMKNGEPLFPVPATLVANEGADTLEMLTPLGTPLPGWESADGMKPLWRRGPGPARRLHEQFITKAGMKAFLGGRIPERGQLVSADDLYGHDRRTGIGIDGTTLTAEEGKIYAVNLLALKKDVLLYMEIAASADIIAKFPRPEGPATIKLGGEGRYARFYRLGKPGLDFGLHPSGNGSGVMLVLLTPGLFSGWKPPDLNGPIVSAAVAGYEAVSGWDMKKGGPKPNRFAVSAGSVYFVSKPPGEGTVGALGKAADTSLGYGVYAMGRFDYA